jgi:hypothetical protein
VKAVTLMLSDAMLDLDRPVTVSADGTTLFTGVAPRTIANLYATLAARGDPLLVFDAAVTVRLDGKVDK